jgi:hypothetical protein
MIHPYLGFIMARKAAIDEDSYKGQTGNWNSSLLSKSPPQVTTSRNMVQDLICDSTISQIVNYVSGADFFPTLSNGWAMWCSSTSF